MRFGFNNIGAECFFAAALVVSWLFALGTSL